MVPEDLAKFEVIVTKSTFKDIWNFLATLSEI